MGNVNFVFESLLGRARHRRHLLEQSGGARPALPSEEVDEPRVSRLLSPTPTPDTRHPDPDPETLALALTPTLRPLPLPLRRA